MLEFQNTTHFNGALLCFCVILFFQLLSFSNTSFTGSSVFLYQFFFSSFVFLPQFFRFFRFSLSAQFSQFFRSLSVSSLSHLALTFSISFFPSYSLFLHRLILPISFALLTSSKSIALSPSSFLVKVIQSFFMFFFSRVHFSLIL